MGCCGRNRQTAMSDRTHSTRQLEPLASRLKARPEDRRIERVLKTIAHEHRVFVFDIHIELADIGCEEIHDLAVVGELPPRQHHLVWAFLIELAQPCVSFVRVHVTPPRLRPDSVLFLFSEVKKILVAISPACRSAPSRPRARAPWRRKSCRRRRRAYRCLGAA